MTDDQLTSAGQAPEPETKPEDVAKPESEATTEQPAPTPAPETAEAEPQAETQAEPKPVQTGDKTEAEMLFEQELARLEPDDPKKKESGPRLGRGERIEATVIQVDKDRVFVDLGTKAEGVVPQEELAENPADGEKLLKELKAGDSFEVVVLRNEGREGNPIVSKRRADFDHAWKKIIEAFEEQRNFDAQVIDRVKGGLVVDIGVRGFVPATHVGSGKLRNIERFVGEILPVRIIEIDRERRKVVLSNKVAEDEKREKRKTEIFQTTNIGDKLMGTVRRIADYGAFVDLGGIDGLLHISEMSWARIESPREVLKEGQEIEVMVLRLDPDRGRISLGYRQVLPDPWEIIRENYKMGQKLSVQVTRLVQNGAFVKLPEGAEAFLPLSEMSNRRIKKPQDVLEEGQDIEPTIINLRPDDRRMVLSLREGAGPSSGGYDYDDGSRGRGGRGGRGRRRREDEQVESTAGRAPTGGATIGERLGMLKGLMRTEEESPTEDAPKEETPKAEEPKAEEPKASEVKAEEPKVEEPKDEAPKAEEAKVEDKPAEEAPKTEEETKSEG